LGSLARSARSRSAIGLLSCIASTGCAIGSTPSVLTPSMLLHDAEERIDFVQHLFVFGGGELQPRQLGDPGDVGSGQRHG
jgi:hypothetical protein